MNKLCKAKDLSTSEWVCGYAVKRPSAFCVGEYSPWFVFVPPENPEDEGRWFNVDPETTCQYIGSHDKYGEKIFEGDRCIFDDTSGVIEYSSDDCMFVFSSDDGYELNFAQIWTYELEVVGNIHD